MIAHTMRCVVVLHKFGIWVEWTIDIREIEDDLRTSRTLRGLRDVGIDIGDLNRFPYGLAFVLKSSDTAVSYRPSKHRGFFDRRHCMSKYLG